MIQLQFQGDSLPQSLLVNPEHQYLTLSFDKCFATLRQVFELIESTHSQYGVVMTVPDFSSFHRALRDVPHRYKHTFRCLRAEISKANALMYQTAGLTIR